MTGRKIFASATILYALLLLLLAAPQWPRLAEIHEWLPVWVFALQAVVPAIVYIEASLRYSGGQQPPRSPVALIEAAILPYLAFLLWMIGAVLLEGEDSSTPRILAAATVTIAVLLLYLAFAETQLADTAPTKGGLARLRHWLRRQVSHRRQVTLLIGAVLLMAAMIAAKDSRYLVTHGFRFTTAQEGAGSWAAWTRAIETALGIIFHCSALLLTIAALIAGFRKRHFGRWIAAVSAALAAAAVADYYFGWLYAYTVGALSTGLERNWAPWWKIAATVLWLAGIVAVPIMTLALRNRSPQTRDSAQHFALLIYTPMLFYVLAMLPLLSESLEVRGESAVLLALQLLAWYFIDEATVKETVEVAPLPNARQAVAS